MSVTQYLKQGRQYKFSGPFDKLDILPAGIYTTHRDNYGGLFLMSTVIQADDLIEMEGSPAKDINRKVDEFLNPKVAEAFKRYNMVYKRGILLYGPPGTGKTSVVNIVIQTAIKKDMVVLLNSKPWDVAEAVEYIRTIEENHGLKNRPVLVVWEEFERQIQRNEEDVLDLLDGIDQIDSTFYIGTTNYIEHIPSRIKNRPSRFAEVIEIGAPNVALRKAYITAKVHKDDKIDIDEWVQKTEGFVLDHIKDLIISVLVLGVPLDEAILKLNIMRAEDDEIAKLEAETLFKLEETMDAPVRAR